MVVHVTRTVLGPYAPSTGLRALLLRENSSTKGAIYPTTPVPSVLRRIYNARSKSDRDLVSLLLCSTQRAEEAHLDYFMAEQRKVIPLSDGC